LIELGINRFFGEANNIGAEASTGFFSRVLLDELRPTRFDAIDFFTLPETQVFWRYKLSEIFQGRTHKGYIEWIFASEIQGGR